MSFFQDPNFDNSSDTDESISDYITKDVDRVVLNENAKSPVIEDHNTGIMFEGCFFENIDAPPINQTEGNLFGNSGNFDTFEEGLNCEFEQDVHGNTNPAVPNRDNSEANSYYRPFTENYRKKSKSKSNPLLAFIDNPNSNMKKGKGGDKKLIRQCPKKEYYRTKLIRSWKKAIRLLGKSNSSPSRAETLFQNHVNENFSILSEISATTKGPLTEAQTKRKDKKTESEAKTFNNSHVLELFSNGIYRESFVKYIHSLFEGKSQKNLCEKFFFNCCTDFSHEKHNAECENLWKRLMIYSCTELIGFN